MLKIHELTNFIQIFMFVSRPQSPGTGRSDRERSHMCGLLEVTLQPSCHFSSHVHVTRLTMSEGKDGIKCLPWQAFWCYTEAQYVHVSFSSKMKSACAFGHHKLRGSWWLQMELMAMDVLYDIPNHDIRSMVENCRQLFNARSCIISVMVDGKSGTSGSKYWIQFHFG